MSSYPAGSKRPAHLSERVGVVILAAGYGTRLARDMAASEAFEHLKATPKPLLPVGGRVILDHWVLALEPIATLAQIVVVTNAAHMHMYESWAAHVNGEHVRHGAGCGASSLENGGGDRRVQAGGSWADAGENAFVRLCSDGSTSNDNRLGAVADMQIGLDTLASLRYPPDVAVIIAGDTLLPDLNMSEQLCRFCETRADIGIFGYPLSDITDCVRRGMLDVDESGRVIGMVEKPSVEDCPASGLAAAPVYFLRRSSWRSPADYLAASKEFNADLRERDAPGFWLSWAIPRKKCSLLVIRSRVDIGGLKHYKDALVDFAKPDASARLAHEPAVGRALPRVGLLGNPSDGYGGKCIAFAILSEGFAEVVATPSEFFAVIPNPVHEMPQQYESLTTCAKYIADQGIHYGASQLVLAGVSMFVDAHMQQRWKRSDVCDLDQLPPAVPLMANCHLRYSTSIPTRLGLSGSSALILATIRALARFHNTSLERIDEDISTWPQRVRRAETDLLGISAGLMDRVAQVYEGCTYMDLSNEDQIFVERLDHSRLPQLWLAYSNAGRIGECSGEVHNDLRERWESGDRHVIMAMNRLANLAEQGRRALKSNSPRRLDTLRSLMQSNWETRLELVGAAGVPDTNMTLVRTAQIAGFVAKQTGSGGAIVCIPKEVDELSQTEIDAAREVFNAAGFVLRPVVVSPPVRWQP